MLATNIIIPFDGEHASIPNGFTRDTRFDGKFPKGAESSLASTGGSNTHTHTATHTHDIEEHNHRVSTGSRISGNIQSMGTSGGVTWEGHSHPLGGGTGTTSGTSSSTEMSLESSSENSLPPYYEVIFIKASNYVQIPVNGIIFRTSARANMTYHSDSDGKFLRGAGTSQNAGSTGGASTHTHEQTHTHTPGTHSHDTGTTGLSDNNNNGEDGGNTPPLAHGHTHTFEVNDSTQNILSDSTTSDSASSIPVNKTLTHYVATAQTALAVGDIAMTTESTNPTGWITCDGTNGTPDLDGYYIQNDATPNTESGSNTHSHDTPHGHTGTGTHTHSVIGDTSTDYGQGGRNNSGNHGVDEHRHTISTVESVTANYDSDDATSSTDSNEPEYIQVKFIQATKNALMTGGSFIFNLI